MRFCLVLLASLLFSAISAQTSKHSFGIYTSFENSNEVKSGFGWGKGQSGYTGHRTTHVGIEYIRSLNTWLKVAGGLEYARRSYTIQETPNSYAGFPLPAPIEGNVQLITFPLYLRVDVLKYFFMTFGTIVDVQLHNSISTNLSGMGITGGTGIKYETKKHLGFYLHPYYQFHGLLKFGSESSSYKQLLNIGVRTGITYRL